MGARYVGARVRRVEDPRLLAGHGRYVDDLRVSNCLHAVLLRSPHAHARVAAIRSERARRHPAVVGVFGFEDLQARMVPLPTAGTPPPALQSRVGFQLRSAPQYPLARGRARYVGEPVAVVVALDRYAAEDARQLVEVEWEPLPVVTDPERGLAPDAPLIHPEWGDNVAVAFRVELGDAARALREAPVVVRRRLRMQRYAGMPMEPRG
ncbi:MAG TPA: xanthine dehydrogenase family protein molybdopterin-binding subunit, partial [Methylomirabilota bacterium]|nr:xanthine dehydrogenase family protein molybdopterin-binding subunit [Methylomirabilota bacterium]